MSPDNGVPAAASPGEGLPVPGAGAPRLAGATVPVAGEGAPRPGDDLALVAARFGAALRAAGVPADPGRCERFASAVTVARPVTVSGLYLCALATLVANLNNMHGWKRGGRGWH